MHNLVISYEAVITLNCSTLLLVKNVYCRYQTCGVVLVYFLDLFFSFKKIINRPFILFYFIFHSSIAALKLSPFREVIIIIIIILFLVKKKKSQRQLDRKGGGEGI